MKKLIALAGAAVAAALVAVPFASSHATVALLLPQGKALTAARVEMVLRVPNERTDTSTFTVAMDVPAELQTGISVEQIPGWTIVLNKFDTGQKSASGEPVFAVTKVRWIASKASRIAPRMYFGFRFRAQLPSQPSRLCFPVDQWYTRKTAADQPELVQWRGDATSATPASCTDVVAS